MKVLLVVATAMEVEPLLQHLHWCPDFSSSISSFQLGTNQLDLLITGIGMVPTAVNMTMALTAGKYDLALNAGICGAFHEKIGLGEVVHVAFDCFSELGTETPEGFLDLQQMKLPGHHVFPFQDGWLANPHYFDYSPLIDLKGVKGITVNTVHGDAHSIGQVIQRLQPDIESMEGAAFMYSALMSGTRFLQIRSVSNYVGPRDTSLWNIPLAVNNLNQCLISLIAEIFTP